MPKQTFLLKGLRYFFSNCVMREGEVVSFFTPEALGFVIQTMAAALGLYARNTVLNCRIYFWLSASCLHRSTSEFSGETGLLLSSTSISAPNEQPLTQAGSAPAFMQLIQPLHFSSCRQGVLSYGFCTIISCAARTGECIFCHSLLPIKL